MSKERLIKHWDENKKFYIGLGVGVGFAGITTLIVRGTPSQAISRGISATANHGISVTGKRIAIENLSYISVNRPGPASWVVRCLETDQIFMSQSAAASAMHLPASELSKHLNGLMDHVRGYTFERICMAL